MTDKVVNIAVNREKKAVRDAAARAVSDLDLIINNIDTATASRIKAAIKTLARHQRIIIRRLVQIEKD